MRRQSRLLLAGGIVLLAAPSHAFETQNRELLEAMGWNVDTSAPAAETIEKLGLSAIV